MKIVIPGGTGQLGALLTRALLGRGDDVVVLSRGGLSAARVVTWDGRTLGAWADEIDGADAVINLAGRTVNCRYNKTNLTEMLVSRIDSTRVVGQAIAAATHPPRVWLQASTATIYAHRLDAPNDEASGVIGGYEPDVPAYWRYSVEIAHAWERELRDAQTPDTRRVALRAAMVMGPETGGPFAILYRLARFGLGGAIAGGAQYMSWIHHRDFERSVLWLLEHDEIEGPIIVAAPAPLPQREFMRTLRATAGMPIGLPATRWMLELGTFVLRTDAELVLKSRRVVPGRLIDAGFDFEFPSWAEAARDLAARQ